MTTTDHGSPVPDVDADAAARRTVRPRARRSTHLILRRIVLGLLVASVGLWTLLPLIWAALTTFKQPLEVFQPGLLPDSWSPGAYERVLGETQFVGSFLNTAILAFSVTALTLVVSAFAAYAFARFKFWMRHLLLIFVLVPLLVPGISIIVPLFQLVATLGLLDTWPPIILAVSASVIPMATWILTGFFQGLPREIEEAAAVDGASVFQRLRLVVVPIAIPGFLAAGVLCFREAWNEFALVLALTVSPERRTLPYELFLLRDSLSVQDIPMQNAFALMAILPLLLLYLRLERYIVSGLTKGALK